MANTLSRSPALPPTEDILGWDRGVKVESEVHPQYGYGLEDQARRMTSCTRTGATTKSAVQLRAAGLKGNQGHGQEICTAQAPQK